MDNFVYPLPLFFWLFMDFVEIGSPQQSQKNDTFIAI